jgi:glycosyltransferase involved in cell wall biosynthesis
VAIAVWPWAGIAPVADTLRDIIATTPDHWSIALPAGGCSAPVDGELSGGDGGRIRRLTATTPSFAVFVNAVAAADPRADIIVFADAARLPETWAEALRRAAYADDTVAAASTLSRSDGGQLPQLPPTGMGEAPPVASSPSRPRTVAPAPPCAWLRRTALDLVAPLDESLQPPHPALVLADFAARALHRGLSCTVADDLLLDVSPGGLDACPPAGWEALWRLHPWLEGAFADEQAPQAGPLRRSLVAARAASRGLSVTIDARGLAGVGGTQTYTGALVLALARSQQLSVRAVVAHDAPSEATDAFSAVGVQLVSYEQAAAGVALTDIVHRPQQVFTPDDLRLLRMLGERVVVSHLDLIAFRVPTYHASLDAWRSYRRTTRLALAAADHVVFFSEHARHEAIGEGLVAPGRTGVAGIGVQRPQHAGGGRRPPAVPVDREFLLALGADYAHKNRPFVLTLMGELRRRHGWPGMLVLAGTHVPHGSSADAEHDVIAADPELAGTVVDLGPVSDSEKHWLLEHATAHVSASTYEGFGLAPLEAAAAGRPCVYAPCTSLGEIIDPAAATITAWDPIASADAAIGLLEPGEAQTRHLELLNVALSRFGWRAVVADVIAAYESALAAPYTSAAPRAWDELEREELIVELATAREDLQARVAHGQSLIDSRDPLLTQAQQRGLMRVASRRWLRSPLLAPFGLLGADDSDGSPE